MKYREERPDGSVLVTYEEMPEYIKAIYAELLEIAKVQEARLSEAFDLIKEWHTSFSW